MKLNYTQRFYPEFAPPMHYLDAQFAKGIADKLFERFKLGEEKIVSFNREVESTKDSTTYRGYMKIDDFVRCKDCVHYKGHWYCEAWNNSPGFPAVTEDGFCNMAERRTDACN